MDEAIDLKAIADAALDEWEKEAGEVAEDAALPKPKPTSSVPLPNPNGEADGSVAAQMQTIDFTEHDRAYHGGRFDPEKQTCKDRDNMAKAMAATGTLERAPQQLKEKLGQKAVDYGRKAAGRDNAKGDVDHDLARIRKLNVARRQAKRAQGNDSQAYRDAEARLNEARMDYIRKALGEGECEAVGEINERAKQPGLRERVKGFIDRLVGRREALAENGISDPGDEARGVAVEMVSETLEDNAPETSGGDAPGKRYLEAKARLDAAKEAARQAYQADGDQSRHDEAARVAQEEFDREVAGLTGTAEKTDVGEEKPAPAELTDPLQPPAPTARTKTRTELAADLESARREFAEAFKDGTKTPEELNAISQRMEDIQSEINKRNAKPDRVDIAEDLTNAETSLNAAKDALDALRNNRDMVSDEDMAIAENAVAAAQERYDAAFQAAIAFARKSAESGAESGAEGGGDQPPQQQQEQQEQPSSPQNPPERENERVAREFMHRGRKYVDISNIGFLAGMVEAIKAGWNGKEIITEWDKMTGRWDGIDMGNARDNATLDAFKRGVGGVTAQSGLAEMLGERLKDQSLPIEERMAITAALDSLSSGTSAQVVFDKMQKSIDAVRKAADARAVTANKEARADEKARTDAISRNIRDGVIAPGMNEHEIRAAAAMREKNMASAKKAAILAGNDGFSGLSPTEQDLARQYRRLLDDKTATAEMKRKKAAIDTGDASYPGLSRAEQTLARYRADKIRQDRIMPSLKLGVTPEGVELTQAEKTIRDYYAKMMQSKYTAQQISLAKSGVLADGVDPNSDIGQIAAMQKQKMKDAADKAALALDKVKGQQLAKTYAETDPGIIALMETTARDMDATGDSLMQARASQIRNTIINTLKTTHNGMDAYNAVHKFKKLLGVDDETSGKKRGDDGSSPFVVPGVDHRNGGVVSGKANSSAVMDTSFLDRSNGMSQGRLYKQNEAIDKILRDIQQSAGMQLTKDKVNVSNRVSSTQMSIDFGSNRVNGKDLCDAIETGMGNVVGTKDANGKDKLPVTATYDRGTNSITVTFPNDEKGRVNFANVLDHKDSAGSNTWRQFKDKNRGKGALFIGVKQDGMPHTATLEDLIHVMIAGQTGAGKSVKEHTIINSLIEANTPDDLQFIMIDPKRSELSRYEGDKHVLDVTTDMNQAKSRFDFMVDESENRQRLFQQARVRSIDEYNKLGEEGKLPSGMPQHLPRIALVADELADLMTTHGKDIDKAIGRLAQTARSQGLHLILATQRPDSTVIKGNVKNSIPSTIGMSVQNPQSATVVGIDGLDKMPKQGPYALKTAGGDVTYGEGAYMSNDDIDGMVKASKAAYGSNPIRSSTTPNGAGSSSSNVPTIKRGLHLDKKVDDLTEDELEAESDYFEHLRSSGSGIPNSLAERESMVWSNFHHMMADRVKRMEAESAAQAGANGGEKQS